MINQIITTKVILLIKGGSYNISQNLDTPITIDTERGVNTYVTPSGRTVSVGSNNASPYVVGLEATNINKAFYLGLKTTFEENRRNNQEYSFRLIIEGFNNDYETIKMVFKDCVFTQAPIQTSIGNGEIPVVRMSIASGDMELS